MEGYNNNSNNTNDVNNDNSSKNTGYSFFNMKNDHGFNDNINSAVESAKSNLATRIILAISMTIVGVSLAMIIRGAVSHRVTDNYNTTIQNTVHSTFQNTIDDAKNTISSPFKSIGNLIK